MAIRADKLKVVYITFDGRIPSRSANSIGVMKLCGHLSTLGLEVDLVIPAGRSIPLSKLGDATSVFEFYSVPSKFNVHFLFNPLKKATAATVLYALFLYGRARLNKASVILTRNVEVAYWALVFGTPVVFESHNFAKTAKSWLFHAFVRRINRPGNGGNMVVTTQAGRRSYIERGVPSDRIMVIPNGVDRIAFDSLPGKEVLRYRLGLPASAKIVGFSGSLYEGRGIEELLRCAEVLKGLTFLVVGGSPAEVDKYQTKSKEMNLHNLVFVGHVSQSSVPSYLKASDVLLMPYTTKTAHPYMSPMKLFDYLASGCPIVATDFPILHEILRDKENVVFVAPDSGDAMAEGIQWLLDHPDQAKSIGAQAQSNSAQYTWENRANGIFKWLQKSMASKTEPSSNSDVSTHQ